MLTYPSESQKNRKEPANVHRTPSVALFDAACDLVYTSGSRISPIALKKLKLTPNKMNSPEMISITSMCNSDTPLQESCKGDGADKRENTYQKQDVHECMCPEHNG